MLKAPSPTTITSRSVEDAIEQLEKSPGPVALCFASSLPDLIRLLQDRNAIEKLTALNLYGNRLGAEGARALAGSTALRHLTSLNLYGNKIGPVGAEALADSRLLCLLASLDMSGNRIGARGKRALQRSPHLPRACLLQL